MPEDLYQKNQIEVLNEPFRVTKSGGSFFYDHKIRWERGKLFHPMDWLRKTKWTIRQEIIWDRMIAANIRGWRFWQVEERI
ncbi:MAG: DNA-methyltransferase, partial [Ignavibacterium sp.]